MESPEIAIQYSPGLELGTEIFENGSDTNLKVGFDAWNSSQFQSLLYLHTILTRYNNYTQQADKCNSSKDHSDIYSYAERYKDWHGYCALLVCIFGVVSNCLIMAVLRRKEMHTPMNLMLLALAMADLLIMLEYIPFALHMYIIDQPLTSKYSHTSALFVFFHVHFTQILHTVSIQLTLSMAIWRYSAVKCSNRSSSLCTFQRCYQVIISAYICPFFFCILNYLYFQINLRSKYITQGPPPFDEIDVDNEEKLHIFQTACLATGQDCSLHKVELYVVGESDLVKEHPLLHTIHFWTFSVLIKLVPCFLLTFFMGWMINTLYKARCQQKRLQQSSTFPLQPMGPSLQKENLQSNSIPRQRNKFQMQTASANTSTVCISPTHSFRFAISHHNEQEQMELPVMLNSDLAKQSRSNSLNVPDTVASSRRTSFDSVQEQTTDDELWPDNSKFARIRIPFTINTSSTPKEGSKSRRAVRTSKMLIVVLLLFLITEFPQGIMHLLTGWYGPDFFRCKYNPLAEIWDIVALINSAVNFILYCFMSRKFRQQFHVFLQRHFCCYKKSWLCFGRSNYNNSTTIAKSTTNI